MARAKYDWEAVNWRLSNREIAAFLACPYDTVAAKRHKLGVGKADNPARRSDKGISKTTFTPPPEQQQKATEAARKSLLAGKYETNIHACDWVLISPDGQVYRARNLYHFVRENKHLFAPKDVIWKRQSGKRGTGGEYCNATAGLLNIKSGKTKGWKGWKLG